MKRYLGLFLTAGLALASPAAAQDPAPPQPVDAPADDGACEFHVWPGDALMSVYYGWFHGSTVNGQIMGRPGYPAVPPDPIDTATQGTILAAAEPHRRMARPDHRLIVHGEALSSRAIRTTAGRLTESASRCYAEFVVDDVVLQQGMNGNVLKTLFRYRDFGADARPRVSFTTWVETGLTVFPPDRPDQLEAAIVELRGAFHSNIAQFATIATRPPRR